ncbi:plasma membrane H+-transporting ATPase [Rhizoctonia solani 123E]|uniref:P-type H(+)-exporting transporter n=1 Tax=Rhizoctonia solani 123E TaxID=1423351 RepID=A0A074RIW8_9AGAM|nr:plasma membrane H+-transporting ATPase [Rhizoctonia solani 123E]
MPTDLSITMAVGAQQLAKYKAIVTRITAIEELAGVTILFSDKAGTLATNKLTIDKELVKTYGPFAPQDVFLLVAYAARTENQDAIDQCVVDTLDDPARARAGIKLLDFRPFNPVDKRTEITYHEEPSGQLKRVTKGMTSIIIELCSRNKTEKVENQLEVDVTEFSGRGPCGLAVAYEELDHNKFESEGNGFEFIGPLTIFDPPREDTKQTIDDAIALGGFGHLCAMTGDGANNPSALSCANIGIAVEGATDAARGAADADIVLTEPGLSTIVHTIRSSRQIFQCFQCMHNYAIYACAVTIRIVVCFATPTFAYQFDFPMHGPYHYVPQRWYHHDPLCRPCLDLKHSRLVRLG